MRSLIYQMIMICCYVTHKGLATTLDGSVFGQTLSYTGKWTFKEITFPNTIETVKDWILEDLHSWNTLLMFDVCQYSSDKKSYLLMSQRLRLDYVLSLIMIWAQHLWLSIWSTPVIWINEWMLKGRLPHKGHLVYTSKLEYPFINVWCRSIFSVLVIKSLTY